MPDSLTSTGLQTKTLAEIRADLETALRDIYGSDINLESNSPDGQLVNIYAQAGVDLRELITEIYNSFDPDSATGRLLDQRVALNNIVRAGGTYTNVPIDITVDRTVNLAGLDADFNNPDGTGYTVSDDSGNEFILIDSQTLTAGTHTVNFRAREIGAVEVTNGTIVNPVTIVLGVTSVINNSGVLQTGQDEETDAQLRVRRASSVANASNGYLNGLLGSVLAVEGVTEAKLYENVTDSVDADGIPAHGIWLIVEGGANTDIGDVIYDKKSYGANMKGDVEVDITTGSGATFTAKFDRPTAEDLYIRFDIQPTMTGASFDTDGIKDYIVENLTYNVGESANTATATVVALSAINATGGNGVPVNLEVSNNGSTWVDYLDTATKDGQFTLTTARITTTEL